MLHAFIKLIWSSIITFFIFTWSTIKLIILILYRHKYSLIYELFFQNKLNIDYHGKTPDGEFDLSAVYCLGNCARGPSIRVNDDIVGSVDSKKFDELTSRLTTFFVELI